MNIVLPEQPGVYQEGLVVPNSVIDGNGHVNNVAFVQWMQDIATRHFESTGSVPAMHAVGATWVARTHHVEYLSPAFAGETLRVQTWVADFRRVRSRRRYRFIRESDHKLLVRGETEWVFIDTETGRPCTIPEEITRAFILMPSEPE